MKILRIYTLFILTSLSALVFAVTLPSQSFFGANELYEINQDYVEISDGTKITGINFLLASGNESWGNECWGISLGDQADCQYCCSEKLRQAESEVGVSADNDVLFDTCFEICGGGPSLPLGSVLWLIPFAFAYAIYKNSSALSSESSFPTSSN